MTDQSEQINPNGTIYAITEGTFGAARVNIGTPYETAVAYPDAKSYYMADNTTCTFVRLAHVVTGRRGEESHQWFYWEPTWEASDYVDPRDVKEEDRVVDPVSLLPDLAVGEEGESFFGALTAELLGDDKEVSRGKVFATAVVKTGVQIQEYKLHSEGTDA